jgi:hypothetical protein
LFLCYNRHLCAWLQEQAKHDPRAQRAAGRLEISTFHSWVRAFAATKTPMFSFKFVR